MSQEGYMNPTYKFKVFSSLEIICQVVDIHLYSPKTSRGRPMSEFQLLASSRPAGLHSETV